MSFNKAFNETMDYEGGYVFDPVDTGGETYKGISRRYNPTWMGWKIVDSYKPFTNGYAAMYADPELNTQVKFFYEAEYWLKPQFDEVDHIWEELAEKLFDTGVNVGVGRVSKWLQASLNLLNRNNKYYQDITVDGGIGPQTLKTLKKAMESNPKSRIMTVLVLHQGEHYMNIMRKNPSQERYVGWFDRLSYE